MYNEPMAHSIVEEFKKTTQSVIENLKKDIASVRSNRPSSTLFDNLKVNYYDQQTPLKQLANVNVIPPRQIVVQVWDKNAVSNVAKAIETSGLGFSPNIDGTNIKVFLPELNHERREELIKYVKAETEKHRIHLRHSRDEANKLTQKLFDGNEITEDMKYGLKEEIQKVTDHTNEEIEKALDAKIREIQE